MSEVNKLLDGIEILNLYKFVRRYVIHWSSYYEPTFECMNFFTVWKEGTFKRRMDSTFL